MVVEGLDRVLISKLTFLQAEQVTCIECCKYFIAPETATCGHTLCHACWKGRRICHTCAAPVDRKNLKVNRPLQTLTEHIHALTDAFEKLFNIKLADFTLDGFENLLTQDPTKNVKEWLADSDNQFSGPVISQMTEPDLPQQMELSKSKIQIHSSTNKSKSPVKVVKPLLPQEDWDKIEVLPDTEECVKQKENVIGPMDLEPFFFDENEYSNDNPRRSARKRELNANSNPPTFDVSADKNSTKNSNIETKSLKTKQTWRNVKKMKKEFSKLNNRNKSKLNISIEMCKNAQAANKSKQAQTLPPQTDSEQTNIVIDDQTPHLSNKEKHVDSLKIDNSDEGKQIQIPNNNMDTEEELPKAFNNKNTLKSPSNVEAVLSNDNNSVKRTSSLNTHTKTEKSNTQSNVCRPVHMPFIKKGALRRKSTNSEDNHVKIVQEEVESSISTAKTDDIEISIKIGNTITNIVIKNKRNDVQMKVNTDREIQTSLEPYNHLNKKDAESSPIRNVEIQTSIEPYSNLNKKDAECSPIRNVDVQNIELNIDVNDKVEVTKTISTTKKNTASADTAPFTVNAQFEITDSMERELSDVMEHLERKRKKPSLSQKYLSSAKASASSGTSQVGTIEKETSNTVESLENKNDSRELKQNAPSPDKSKQAHEEESEKFEKINEIPEGIEDFNDVDIFNSGSVKEANVKLLKDSKVSHSEILIPTIKGRKSQKVADKREREKGDDIEELPYSKKQRIDLDSINEDKEEAIVPVAVETKDKDLANNSEQMNYDDIMSQVFANIDADMNKSSKNTEKTLVLKTTSESQIYKKDTPLQVSQIIHKTQKKRTQKADSDIEIVNDSNAKDDNQKFSENVFSMLEKDNELHNASEKNNNQLPGRLSTQQHIANLLTPGACDDLAHTHTDTHTQKQPDKDIDIVELVQGTPVGENDDESVVEETPQKNISFSKSKQSNDATKSRVSDVQKWLENSSAEKRRKLEQKAAAKELEMIRSIINISDSSTEPSKAKNTTVAETAINKTSLSAKISAETPLNINKFVNNIQHNSTPVARKSLNFDSESLNDPEQTICPTTTQEQALIAEAFRQSQTSSALGRRVGLCRPVKKYFVAGSCLSAAETKTLKILCQDRGWTYLDKYSDELTHLVVGVDDEHKSQRSVKYMCALAASKWIVSYDWVEKCLQTKTVASELPYEVLDACGEPGPKRSRTAVMKVFEEFTFHCLPPFSILNIEILKQMLEAAGGKVVSNLQGALVTADTCSRPAVVLAEPEATQEDRLVFLAMKHKIVPLNYEWALNCLGSYKLCSIHDLLLCPVSLLPPDVNNWPAHLRQSLLACDDDEFE